MKYKLLVLDIDGTVTNSKKEVTEKTKNAILDLQKRGIPVAIASGRAPQGIYSVAKALELDKFGSYIMPFNGARIINFKTEECIYSKTLPLHLPARLWRDAVENGIGIVTYDEKEVIAGTELDKYILLEAKIAGMPVVYHENFNTYVDFPVNKCLMTGEPEDLETLEPVFAQKYFHEAQIFRSEPYFLEATPKNVDKAYCLKHLLEILGIKREEMICCGDGFNDISMIQYAGLGVAMANAQDQVKAVADYVTVCDNDHDGIAEVIEKFF